MNELEWALPMKSGQDKFVAFSRPRKELITPRDWRGGLLGAGRCLQQGFNLGVEISRDRKKH